MSKENYPNLLAVRLGYYEFGGVPTIVDPRTSGSTKTDLTNLHEQTHRDLINNTFWGYAILRTLDLLKLKGEKALKEQFNYLASAILSCAEGEAVACEALVCAVRDGKTGVSSLTRELPADYRRAFSFFSPLLGDPEELRGNITIPILRQALITAVAELTLDLQLIESDRWDSFADMVRILRQSRSKPEDNLLATVGAAVTNQMWPQLELDPAVDLKNLATTFRHHTMILKKDIAKALGGEALARRVKSDAEVVRKKEEMDLLLRTQNPELPHLIFDHPLDLGTEKVDIMPPSHALEELRIPGCDLADAAASAASSREGLAACGVRFLKSPNSGKYIVQVNFVKATGVAADLDSPYFFSDDVERDQLLELGNRIELPVLGIGFLLTMKDGNIYDYSIMEQMTVPVFLYSREFGWAFFKTSAERIGKLDRIVYLPCWPGVGVIAYEIGKVSLFAFISAGHHRDWHVEGMPLTPVTLQERPMLGFASMITARTIW